MCCGNSCRQRNSGCGCNSGCSGNTNGNTGCNNGCQRSGTFIDYMPVVVSYTVTPGEYVMPGSRCRNEGVEENTGCAGTNNNGCGCGCRQRCGF